MAQYIVELDWLTDYSDWSQFYKFTVDLSKDQVKDLFRKQFAHWDNVKSQFKGGGPNDWWYDQRTIHELLGADGNRIYIPVHEIEHYSFKIYTLEEWFNGQHRHIKAERYWK